MDRKAWAAAVKAAIEKSGKTRVDVGREAGLSESLIRAIESCKGPRLDRADDLMRALGLRMVIGDPDGKPIELPVKRRRVSRG